MPAKPKLIPRNLEIVGTHEVTPNMKRITLGGEELEGFPAGMEGSYIKLWFPWPGESEVGMPDESKPRGPGNGPMMRTYTIRNHRPEKQELDIDFVVHGDEGPASGWAMNAKPGDRITISGPGVGQMVDTSADWFFMVGDMTALPALAANLKMLPDNARGYFVMEVIGESDIQDLAKPDGIEMHWVVNPHPGEDNRTLPDKVREMELLDGRPSVWTACEFSSMRALRHYFRQECNIDRFAVYASSYWKIGVSEDEHKLIKRRDKEANGD
ncbi:MAG: siderophore-interacting protein [Gammaproteobacteria bacterium]